MEITKVYKQAMITFRQALWPYYIKQRKLHLKSLFSLVHLEYLYNRFSERLWVKPLFACLVSISAVFLARYIESLLNGMTLPAITYESVDKLLSVLAASMLVIATFSVASMVSAYASAASTATPRAFALIVADDKSQNALSTFIGAFIYSLVAIVALTNDYFFSSGLFVLFILTLLVFALVILTFVRWVDSIARLGRMSSTIEKVENATHKAMKKFKSAPTQKALSVYEETFEGHAVYVSSVGYIQYIDIEKIQKWAERHSARVRVKHLPGKLINTNEPVAYIQVDKSERTESEQAGVDKQEVINAFHIGRERLFDFDPRFGLVVLSEIASRALSPAVNDPGTSINILSSLTRLFTFWSEPVEDKDIAPIIYNRVEVPEISLQNMFDDAFTGIARDGAGLVEVGVMLQKCLTALTKCNHSQMKAAANRHSQSALNRAEQTIQLKDDFEKIKSIATIQ